MEMGNITAKATKKEMFLKVIFYIAVFIGFYSIVCSISPLSDDWYYLTGPNPSFQLADLLPGDSFWRPFDALFGAFMGLFAELFPALNRAVVVLAHVLNAVLLSSITRKMGMELRWRRFTVCFFLFSSAVWAVTVSPDALNQAYSVLFGLVAIWLHLKKGGYYYILFCLIALFWKESGVSWFFVIPILDAFLNGKTWNDFRKNSQLVKRFFKQVSFSFLTIIAYFAARFALYGQIALGESGGTYSLSLLSFSTVKNAVLLFASAATGVDSLALFGAERSLALVAITVVLSMVFVVAWLVCAINLLFKKKKVFPFLCILVCVLGLAFPLMILGSAGEMHAYPVLCGMSMLFGFGLSQSGANVKKMLVPILCLFIAFGISSAHKLLSVYDYSDRTKQLTQSIMENYDTPEGRALFVVVDDWTGYSVFDQSAIMGTYKGYSVRQYFDWVEVEHEQYAAESEEDADAYIEAHADEYDKVFIIEDETAQRVK